MIRLKKEQKILDSEADKKYITEKNERTEIDKNLKTLSIVEEKRTRDAEE